MRCDSPTRCGAPRRPPKTAARTVPSQRLHGTRIQPSTKATRSRRYARLRSRDALPTQNTRWRVERRSRATRWRSAQCVTEIPVSCAPHREQARVCEWNSRRNNTVAVVRRPRRCHQARQQGRCAFGRVRAPPHSLLGHSHAEMGPPSTLKWARPAATASPSRICVIGASRRRTTPAPRVLPGYMYLSALAMAV